MTLGRATKPYTMLHRRQACRRVLFLCLLLSPYLPGNSWTGPAVAVAAATGKPVEQTTRLPLNASSIEQGVAAFVRSLESPYDLGGSLVIPTDQLKNLSVGDSFIQRAENLRNSYRQGLVSAFDGTPLENITAGNSSTLFDSLLNSSVPISFGGNAANNSNSSSGNRNAVPRMPIMSAIGTYLGQQVEEAVTAMSGYGDRLQGLFANTAAGRKLLQADEVSAFDAFASDHPAVSVSKQVNHIKAYLTDLAGVAQEVFDAQAEEAAATSKGSNVLASKKRQLQQQDDGSPLGGYANAIRLIFTNIFDLFRADGLYALTPIIADLRGIFTRYNWIGDLARIIQAPFENIFNANYYPLPQSNDDFIALVRRYAEDYCTFEEATNSEQVLGEYTGPTLTFELLPVSCPIYADPATGREYISFADCDPAQLVITVTPLTVTEAYLTAATYTGTECKYTEVFGTDFELNVGNGEQSFTFERSAQGIDIVPTVIQLNNAGEFYNFEDEDADADEGAQANATVSLDQAINATDTIQSVTLAGNTPDVVAGAENTDYA
eukprot:GHRR01000560.1.p1 GENE.GHRR01000560.1~~GHRR01000560.1.p1  ORF type:complete len:549 (+),score=163.80 GHRR01000560.1:133-1779(+)